VGGGVFGAVTAFELARAGRRVVLLERDPVGGHASGRNPANLNPLLGTPPGLLPLALASFRLHEELHEALAEIGCGEYGLEPVRRALVWFDETEREALVPVARAFDERPGFSADWLSSGDLARLERRTARDAAGAVLLEGNRSLDAVAFNRALLAAASRLGAAVVQTAVRRIDRRPDGFRVVCGDGGAVECHSVVLATGPWVAEAREWLGITVPVRPVRGQMVRVKLAGGPLAIDVTHGPISLYRRGPEAAWVGATHEEAGFDERPTADGLRWLLDAAARVVPVVREGTVFDHGAALRPTTPDGMPLVGPVARQEGVFVANGGGGKGMLLCAAAGRALREIIVDGGTALPVTAVASGRVA